MSKAATSFYAVRKGRKVGVFTGWEETQPLVQGFPGAKFKKFKTQPEADEWYRSNLLRSSVDAKTATATPSTSTVTSPNAIPTFSSSTAATRSSLKRSTSPISKLLPRPTPKPLSQSTSKTATITTSKPAQPLRVATPENATVDIVYTKAKGSPGTTAGIGVWWGLDDPRNLSERCPGPQTNNRAELIAILRVLETVPQSSNTLIIRTDSQYSQKALTGWSFNWRKNGWRTAGGKPVVNKEPIDYILTLLETRQRSGQPVRFEYVKGHSGDVGNDGAGALAVAGCSCPEIPERDWVGLKESHNVEQDITADLVRGIDPADLVSSDEDLMRELEEEG